MAANDDTTELAEPFTKQIEYSKEAFELLDTQPDPPVYADQNFAGLEYCERKGVYDRETDASRPERVQTTTEMNTAVSEAVPTTFRADFETVWRHIDQQLAGGFKNIHPVMKRQGIYILGTPHLLTFVDGQPRRVVRLHSSSRRNLTGEFPNRRVGPWLTCRILDRTGFDTSNLLYFVVTYCRDTYSTQNPQLLADIEQTVATATTVTELAAALEPWDGLHVFGQPYDRHQFAVALNRWIPIWKGSIEPEGTSNEAKCRTCPHTTACPDSSF